MELVQLLLQLVERGLIIQHHIPVLLLISDLYLVSPYLQHMMLGLKLFFEFYRHEHLDRLMMAA